MGGGSYRLKSIRKTALIFLLIITLISIILINKSEAKYQVGKVYEDIVSGNVKNNIADYNLVSIYINGEKVSDNQVPINGYLLDLEKTKCTLNNEELSNITFEYKYGKIGVYGISEAKTKCNFYFVDSPTKKIIDSSLGKLDASHFTKTSCLNGTNNETRSSDNCNEETNGVYEETTSLGKTYYYRGTVNNNWVKYGTNASGLPIWWRIIRINEDGTIRLLYIGESQDAPISAEEVNGQSGYWMSSSGINNARYSFNVTNNQNAYIGYMYGTPGSNNYESEHGYDLIDAGNVNQLQDSNVKTVIDDWYVKNLADENDALSGSTGFCGDRSIGDDYLEKTGAGSGAEQTSYKAFYRITKSQGPSLDCPDSAHDLYTTKNDKGNGNGALDYPIGLITIDEANYAGGIRAISGAPNYGYWLSQQIDYWTITPAYFDKSIARVFYVQFQGMLIDDYINNGRLIRPVINVKPEYFNTENKNGTITNPYIVEI